MSSFDTKANSALYWTPQLIIATLVCSLLATNSYWYTYDIGANVYKIAFAISICGVLAQAILFTLLLGIIRCLISKKKPAFIKRDCIFLIVLELIFLCFYFLGKSFFAVENASSINFDSLVQFNLNINILCFTIISIFYFVLTILILINNHFDKKSSKPYTKPSRIILVMFVLALASILSIYAICSIAQGNSYSLINNFLGK